MRATPILFTLGVAAAGCGDDGARPQNAAEDSLLALPTDEECRVRARAIMVEAFVTADAYARQARALGMGEAYALERWTEVAETGKVAALTGYRACLDASDAADIMD